MEKYKETIRNNLTKYRKERGMTKKDLAKAVGVAQSSVTQWEKGENSIDLERFFRICDILDISSDEMAGRDAYTTTPTADKEILTAYHSISPAEQSMVRRSLNIPDQGGEWEQSAG